MNGVRSAPPRLILFGAFDRHNFGDLLLAHCAAAGDRREPVFAGLVERDLRLHGGHRVHALGDVMRRCGHEPAELVVVGGEVLATTAWEAAVMLQSPAEAALAIRLHDRSEDTRTAWAHAVLGHDRALPYLLSARDVPSGWTVELRACGGVAFDSLPATTRARALAALETVQRVSVRDAATHAALSRHGIATRLRRDPASDSACLFGAPILERLKKGELSGIQQRRPDWLAVQIASHWGNDAELNTIASRIAAVAARTQLAPVLFRAGIAPWHDDRDTLSRLARRIEAKAPTLLTTVFESTHVFDICALLAGARGYVGSSLHGWIVADSFGIPAICLVRHPHDKAAAYLDTWHPQGRAWRLPDEEIPIP